jgi:hypothetical protein
MAPEPVAVHQGGTPVIITIFKRDKDGKDTPLAQINTERWQDQRLPIIGVHGEQVVMYDPFGPDPETPESTLYAEVTEW